MDIKPKLCIKQVTLIFLTLMVAYVAGSIFYMAMGGDHPWREPLVNFIYGNSATFQDGLFDRITWTRDPNTNLIVGKRNLKYNWEWRWQYDKQRRLIRQINPAGETRDWLCGEDGKVQQVYISNGQLYRFQYDDKGKAISASLVSATDADNPRNRTVITYDKHGMVTSSGVPSIDNTPNDEYLKDPALLLPNPPR